MYEHRLIDRYGGKNYGCYPLSAPGKNLYNKLEQSNKWKKTHTKNYIDERNDNQCDIDRGSDYIFENIETGDKIYIECGKSRSGKTQGWLFKWDFGNGSTKEWFE